MANLLESYKGRLAVCEQYYSKVNNGAKMDSTRKMITAQCLANVSNFINEGFNNSVGTQRSDLGTFKKFCLDITTITQPNLIVNDLLLTIPMTSFTGFITYMDYSLGTEKGGVGQNTIIQDPFVWEPMTEARSAYSSEAVVEAVAAAGAVLPAWGPVVKGVFEHEGAKYDVKFIAAAGGAISYLNLDAEGKVTVPAAGKIAYKYDNQVIPQEKLPTVTGRMNGITLSAKARRIAVKYSQFAAYQS